MIKMMFRKEANFKETPIGRIPSDWDTKRLGDTLIILRNGLTARQNKEGKGYPVTRIETISDEAIDHNKFGYLPEVSENNLNEYRLINGDILFSHINSLDHIGKTAIYRGTPELLLHGMNLLLLRPDKDEVDPEYLLYVLRVFRTRNIFRAMAKKAVNQASINLTELGAVKISLPPLPEQQKIAGVLSTVDEAIQKTSEVIAKTERLKKGLMQKLLTRGIGHKEFKDSEIGRIPKEWRVVELGEAVEIDKESRDPTKEIPDETFTYVDIDSIEGGTGKIRNPKRILGKDAPSRARRVIREHDVIMSTVRPYLKAFAMVPKDCDNQICSTGFAVLCCKDAVLPYFLLNVLFSDIVIIQCNRMMMGGQYPALNQSQVSRIKIPLPRLPEQQKIAEVFSAVDQKLELERNEKAKLERIKQGMTELLLTGKIRVRVN